MEGTHASTSKQAAKEDTNDGSGSERKSNMNSDGSYHTWSHTYSVTSQVDVANIGLNDPKPVLGKENARNTKSNERKKRQRPQVGRVDKRKRTASKPQGTRRAPKTRPRNRAVKRGRDISLSTIFTTLSSEIRGRICRHCGHRCCERRSESKLHGREYRRYEKNNRRKIDRKDLRAKRAIKSSVRQMSGAAANQVGSRAYMLSPLFIQTNSTPDENQNEQHRHLEVSPEMIYEAIKSLSMWRQEVKTEAILDYIKIHYPVDPDDNVVMKDLMEKLTVAALAGIVKRLDNDTWCLPSALERRALTESHVTRFWQTYADTMKPLKTEKSPEADNNKNYAQ